MYRCHVEGVGCLSLVSVGVLYSIQCRLITTHADFSRIFSKVCARVKWSLYRSSCFVVIFLYPPHNKVVGGYIGFTPSVCSSARPSVRPASRVCSVVPAILVGSISYLHILSNNLRRCVSCKVSCKINKFGILTIFLKFLFLTLSCFDLGSDVNHSYG